MTALQADATTDLHGVVAALQQRLDVALLEKGALAEELAVRTAELAERKSEFDERIDHQAATIDVLKTMSASPGDPQPVFDLIVRQAQAQCNSASAALYEFDGMIHCRSFASGVLSSEDIEAYSHQFPMPLEQTSNHALTVSIRDRRIVHIRDAGAAEEISTISRDQGVQSAIVLPLITTDGAVGCIALSELRIGGYSDAQIALLQTFAEQAVIAIRSAETYRALQARTTDLQASLEYQTATSDVLKVISRSTFDLQPVLETVLLKAARLCDAEFGVISTREGDAFRVGSVYSNSPEYHAIVGGRLVPAERGTVIGRTAVEGRIVHILDIGADPDYAIPEILEAGGARTCLGVPLLRERAVVGVISLARPRVEAFTEQQIELVSTFADQAVIAMENARLLTETREALEQQTATAELLQTINSSPGDPSPVFDAMLDKALRLCGAAFGALRTFDGETIHQVASRNLPPRYAEYWNKAVRLDPTNTVFRAAVLEQRTVQIEDMAADESYRAGSPIAVAGVELGGVRTLVHVPLIKDNITLGVLTVFRQEVKLFSDKELGLLQNFAAQAVIAMENARLLTEQQEALEQQTATAEVLQVINANPGNLAPVFDAMLEKAIRLCDAANGNLAIFDGTRFHLAATHYGGAEYSIPFTSIVPEPGSAFERVVKGERVVQILDLVDTDAYRKRVPSRVALVENLKARTALWVALHNDNAVVGVFVIFRRVARPFSDKQIALLQNFAAQAVIAMENARLITEQREALEQQTATAEVLQVINASPGDLAPVFQTILDKAMRLCEAAFGGLFTYDEERFDTVAALGTPAALTEFRTKDPPSTQPGSTGARLLETRRSHHILDRAQEPDYLAGDPGARAMVELGGARSMLNVPLLKEDKVLGFISLYRQEVRPFSDKQIALLESFAAQAVIAMENARLLGEIRQRQEELRVTFENMGDGVAMFDETPRLVAWNRKFQEIFNVPDALLAERRTYAEYLRYLGTRGDFGPTVDVEEQIRRFAETAGEYHAYERVRPDGRVIEIRHNPVAGGGFVLIFSDITERKRNEAEIRAARDAAEEASRTIEAAYRDLKTAQANLIQAEKMASLGQLTAGIAHEIKNPLNFVNNFAELSVDLLEELKGAIAPAETALNPDQRDEVDDVVGTLTTNLEKITEHGKRADGIVKAMLEHSRGSSGERRMVDLNALIDEALNLAYHGARAQDQSFNITLERDLGEGIAPIEVNPQDITRVLLNLFANGFYAVTRRARNGRDEVFVPMLKVTTSDVGEAVEVRVRDNGTGIPADVRDKLFQPFFTTKPTGEGTGLGLSITYDIVTQQHGGSIAVDSKVGEYSEFTIRLPRSP
jgi:GAF domain-containing protein/nitrogen-specific signal transduction histidine kinase